jgi:hypothetical protein
MSVRGWQGWRSVIFCEECLWENVGFVWKCGDLWGNVALRTLEHPKSGNLCENVSSRGRLIVVVEYDRCFEGGCVLIAQIFIFVVQFQTHKGAKHRSCVDSGDFMSIVQSLEHSLLSLSTI